MGYDTPQENLLFSNLFVLSPRLAIQSIQEYACFVSFTLSYHTITLRYWNPYIT